ncbi:MAG TPA: metallophosphoesterase [Polyangia bacterium]|nr:metallophosphoesterase [Polyangia bacterium]
MRWLPVLGLVVVAGCAAPLAVHRQDAVLAEVDAHYRAFYPADGDPDPKHDAGLLRPRFGLPAIAQAGQPFAVEWLERGGPATVRAALIAPTVTDAQAERCLAGEAVAGCHPLTLAAAARKPVGAASWARANAVAEAPPGGYDLYMHPACDAATRAPNAVWLRADDPATLGQVRVVHLSDIHIGKHVDDVEAHLEQVIAETNALQPDLVVVTGDVVNQGTDASLHPKARALLETIHAPVAIVLGNHDIGFRSFVGAKYGSGWENFGRTFHAFLEFEIDLGGYRFVGFDSGPSTLSPRILTRGLGSGTLAHLKEILTAAASDGSRGVVLFSHAPSRAVLSGQTPSTGGAFGHMRQGRQAFEQLLLDAAARGQRVLHLAGHTHWDDVFEARPEGKSLAFERWPDGTGDGKLTPIHGKAAMVTTQAATHAGPWPKKSARGFGFTYLVLGDGDAEIAFHRHPDGAADEAIAQDDNRR